MMRWIAAQIDRWFDLYRFYLFAAFILGMAVAGLMFDLAN